jgi:type II secretory pathway pseudopilin PulG
MKSLYTQQTGAALLAFMAIIVSIALAWLVSGLPDRPVQAQNQEKTAKALAQAKEALLGFALSYAETHPGQPLGYLPCPDTDGNGSDSGACQSPEETVIGRFPWRVLGTEPLRDGAGECLWYAVSGHYKDNPKSLNATNSEGQITIVDQTGAPVYNKAIAVIFSPGMKLNGQVRRHDSGSANECGGADQSDQSNQAVNYLDDYLLSDNVTRYDNANGRLTYDDGSLVTSGTPGEEAIPTTKDSVFISAPMTFSNDNVVFNDVIAVITADDFADLNIIEKMKETIKDVVIACFEDFFDTYNANALPSCPGSTPNCPLPKYPWPAELGDPQDYNDDTDVLFGRIPDDLTNSNASNSYMPSSWPDANGASCFSDQPSSFWKYWREDVFIAVSKENAPAPITSGGGGPAALKLDNTNKDVIVIIASEPVGGQSRDTDAQKALISNYLEGDNADGDKNFVSTDSSPFNDIVFGF